jgi:hypothetical protein
MQWGLFDKGITFFFPVIRACLIRSITHWSFLYNTNYYQYIQISLFDHYLQESSNTNHAHDDTSETVGRDGVSCASELSRAR